MAQKVWGRVALILAVLVASVGAYVASGMSRVKNDVTGETTPGLRDYLKNGIKLGLDLRGGIHLVLQVQTSDALKIETDEAIARLGEQNTAQQLKLGAITSTGPSSFTVTVAADSDLDKLQDVAKRYSPRGNTAASGRLDVLARRSRAQDRLGRRGPAGGRNDSQPHRPVRRFRARHRARRKRQDRRPASGRR